MHAVELELENRALKSSLREYKARARTFRHHAASAGQSLQLSRLCLEEDPCSQAQLLDALLK